ncbi:MAG: molybdopterin guanine dinucleotide-containing S/N-oxide reductase [Rhodospirillales bacterium]|nr:molybdopterin guanine dinucleotide-containing S/N-oxide reductase [Rhodospirillales bacterium]
MNDPQASRFVRSASHWGTFWAEVRDGRVVGAKPFEHDTDPSPMIESMAEAVHAENRIDRPYVREGFLEHGKDSDRRGRGAELFVPVDWKTALDLVAAEVRRVTDGYGNNAIYGGSYGWSSAGRMHHAKTLLHRFLHGNGGATVSVNSYSTGAARVLLSHVLGVNEISGGVVTSWDSIVGNTKLFVAFGALPIKNLQLDGGGVGVHSTVEWMRRAKESGTEFVCVGPFRDDAPPFLEAEWLQPIPGTDTAIMMGLAHTLVTEGLHDAAFLDRYCVGWEQFSEYLTGRGDGTPKDADWAAAISGLDAETIRGLARRMAATRTMIAANWSLQRAHHGEQPFWMTLVLGAVLGQIGLPGGGFGYGYGSMHRVGNPVTPVPSPTMQSGANPVSDYIPVARIADLLLQPGGTLEYDGKRITYPDIRMVYWCGGNPFHHHQDLNRLLEAWRRPDTIVFNEIWWTAAARHADIVLPATTTLERNDIASSAYDRYLLAMHKAIDPVGEARNDYNIFADLADRLGFREAYTEGRDEMGWLNHLYDVSRQQAARQGLEMPDFDVFWDAGYLEFPAPTEPVVMLAEFRADPDAHPLATPSGKLEIFSQTIASFGYDDCPGHPVWLAPAEWLGAEKAKRYPLHLISSQPATRLHGQLDGDGVSRRSKIDQREPVWIHPADAASRGIEDGVVVRVFNDRGACLAGAKLSDSVRAGVVVMHTGATFDPAEPGRIGSLDRHGNANMLTLDTGTSRLSQGTSAQTALVEVEMWRDAVPEVGAFSPPARTQPRSGAVRR